MMKKVGYSQELKNAIIIKRNEQENVHIDLKLNVLDLNVIKKELIQEVTWPSL